MNLPESAGSEHATAVDHVKRHFRNSHGHREKVNDIIQLSDEDLLTHHMGTWSVNPLPDDIIYCDQEAHNKAIPPCERATMQGLHEQLMNPTSQLSLYVLKVVCFQFC